MNERIRELADEATKKYDRLGNEIPFAQPDLEKFAQLIVRECARVADVADENKCEWIGGNILTHFGVQE